MKELSLYFHFPFCLKRCRYCDFVSYPRRDRSFHLEYEKAVFQEIAWKVEEESLRGRELSTVYLGGGTPSLLFPEDVERMLSYLQGFFTFSPSVEITMEVNPETVNGDKIKAFQEAGVNRFSVGVQSFNPRFLYFLGRSSSLGQIENVLSSMEKIHCSSWSLDLLYSLPFQSLPEWQQDIEHALIYHPPHLSIYNLTLSPVVPLYSFARRHSRVFPSPDEEALYFEWTMEKLEQEGYIHYEISNFAQPGAECSHNLTYWRGGEYLGVGVSAWSYLGGRRQKNTSSLKNYLRRLEEGKSPLTFQEELEAHQKLAEDIMLRLRTKEGVQSSYLLTRYRRGEVETKLKYLEYLSQEGFIIKEGERFALSKKGILVANQIFQEILD
ncbi:MAG TPA: radical SAM family heme chaperone HemW [Candidatus Atribacteria bacterium]|nr:radical SAM family heme chaperone HemW [Candidatus Atribacteria bacterium]